VRGTLAQGDNSVHLDSRPGTLCDGFTFSGVLGGAVEFNLVSRFAGELAITDPAGVLLTRLGDRAGQGACRSRRRSVSRASTG